MRLSRGGSEYGVCPHYLEGMQACNQFSGGIFLPSEAYLVMYCLVPDHVKCFTYKKQFLSGHCALNRLAGIADERRRYHRVIGQWPVSIHISCLSDDQLTEHTFTLDYSQGGMRIVLRSEIPSDSRLLFSFDNRFFIPRLHGLARLCWQRKLWAGENVEAGIVFVDDLV